MYFQKVILDIAIIQTQDDVKATATIHDSASKELDILCKVHGGKHGGRSLKILNKRRSERVVCWPFLRLLSDERMKIWMKRWMNDFYNKSVITSSIDWETLCIWHHANCFILSQSILSYPVVQVLFWSLLGKWRNLRFQDLSIMCGLHI